MQIGLLGFGTVGSAFYTLAAENAFVLIRKVLEKRDFLEIRCNRACSFSEILEDPDIDTVVELIGGIDPSLDYVSAALSRGKNVVTANKALLSAHYDMLKLQDL